MLPVACLGDAPSLPPQKEVELADEESWDEEEEEEDELGQMGLEERKGYLLERKGLLHLCGMPQKEAR